MWKEQNERVDERFLKDFCFANIVARPIIFFVLSRPARNMVEIERLIQLYLQKWVPAQPYDFMTLPLRLFY